MLPHLAKLSVAVCLASAPLLARQNAPPSTRPTAAATASEIEAGQRAFEAGRFDLAEQQFQLAVAKTPNDAGAWNWLGQARFAQRRWAVAGEAFQRALALAPNDVRVIGNVGVCQYSLQQVELAGATFARAIAVEPSYSRGHMYLARIAEQRGDDAAAEAEFQVAVQSATSEPLAPFYYGLFLFRLRRLDEATAQFERCLTLTPDMPGAHLNLGLIYQRRGDSARAEQHLKRFREVTEVELENRAMQLRVMHLLKSANQDLEADHVDAALGAVLEARDLAPDHPVVHQFLARIYQLQGRKDDAARENELVRTLSEQAAKK